MTTETTTPDKYIPMSLCEEAQEEVNAMFEILKIFKKFPKETRLRMLSYFVSRTNAIGEEIHDCE